MYEDADLGVELGARERWRVVCSDGLELARGMNREMESSRGGRTEGCPKLTSERVEGQENDL
jgi:hypothetical protein